MVAPEVSPRTTNPHDIHDFDEVKGLPQAERDALEKTVWKKLDKWTLPLCTNFFLLAALDKTNIANARVAGLQPSLHMSNSQFSLLLTLDFIPHLLVQLPASLLLKYVGPDIMLPTMAVLWGLASASQGFVHNYHQLLVCRIILGLVEGGVLPAIILYLSFFYPRRRLQIRIMTFFATAALASASSGLLAAFIEKMDGKGNRPGWAWILIIEGIVSIAFGVISYFFLPRSPASARFLTEKERAYVVSYLKHTGSISEEGAKDNFAWVEVVRAFKSPQVWFVSIVGLFSGAITFGLAFFEPTIVLGLGYPDKQAQLMSVPPFVVAFILCLVSAIVSDRYQCRGYNVMLFSVLQVIGFTMFYASKSNHVRYASLFLFVPGAFGVATSEMTWVANNSAPHTRRATALALNFISTEVGGILSSWLLGTLSPPPDFTLATITFIVMSVGMAVISAVNWAYLKRENRLKAEKRQRTVKDEEPDGLGDRSAWFVYSL